MVSTTSILVVVVCMCLFSCDVVECFVFIKQVGGGKWMPMSHGRSALLEQTWVELFMYCVATKCCDSNCACACV
jgi:hypothetical protein